MPYADPLKCRECGCWLGTVRSGRKVAWALARCQAPGCLVVRHDRMLAYDLAYIDERVREIAAREGLTANRESVG